MCFEIGKLLDRLLDEALDFRFVDAVQAAEFELSEIPAGPGHQPVLLVTQQPAEMEGERHPPLQRLNGADPVMVVAVQAKKTDGPT